jgi:phage tail-like protein
MADLFPGNTDRLDPYKNFKFRVKFGTEVVAAVSKVSALKRSTEPVTHREGGDPSTSRLSPSTWKFEPITLERGLTHDPAFEAWANQAWTGTTDAATVSLKDFRRDIRIELLNLQGEPVIAYDVHRCWVSEYQAMPELDSNANAIAIEMMVVQNEGWIRDDKLTIPTES